MEVFQLRPFKLLIIHKIILESGRAGIGYMDLLKEGLKQGVTTRQTLIIFEKFFRKEKTIELVPEKTGTYRIKELQNGN